MKKYAVMRCDVTQQRDVSMWRSWRVEWEGERVK
jgi:hypothetical protein